MTIPLGVLTPNLAILLQFKNSRQISFYPIGQWLDFLPYFLQQLRPNPGQPELERILIQHPQHT